MYSVTTTNVESMGGGVIRLTVNGLLRLDGRISANGLPGLHLGAGGGAGGSVYLTVGRLAGAGWISADGGNGDWPNGGGGGGGRVAIICSGSNSFTGVVSARGGAGHVPGGAGTIYWAVGRESPQLIVDNGGQQGTNTLVAQSLDSALAWVRGGAGLVPGSNLTFNGLEVFPSSAVIFSNQQLRVLGNATVHAGGRIHADGTGHLPGFGPGAGNSRLTPKGGGSHGGLGALNPEAAASGSIEFPTNWGSGGASASGSATVPPVGGRGGGQVHLSVGGTLTVNGSISAHGGNGELNSGGGAGGSVHLYDVGTLAGSGTIAANGGAGSGTGGGGGGGRVTIFCRTNLFTGTVTAQGGPGAAAGGAGTICWKRGGDQPWNARDMLLVVDNGGLSGTNTPLYGPTNLPVDLRIGGGAVVHPQTPFPFLNSLEIGPGGRLTHLPQQAGLDLLVQNHLTIAPGGELTVRGRGYAANSGPGAGGVRGDQGSGGGHGGAGGASASGAPGGAVYGWEFQPTNHGSGGGAFLSGWPGSEGGGTVRVRTGGPLRVDGVLSAEGNDGWVEHAGGGAGGSIW
ncbi:MAG: hypothetical protein RMK20_15245, partial [Verrucomicrobiales bacterium]|nr:hypothetical protein [Verrucomicrobiales bacterium]